MVNARYGAEPGVKAYSHISDRFSPFATQTIPATVHEAPYILDGLLMNETGRRVLFAGVADNRQVAFDDDGWTGSGAPPSSTPAPFGCGAVLRLVHGTANAASSPRRLPARTVAAAIR